MKHTKILAFLLCASAQTFAAAPASPMNVWKMGVEGGMFTQSYEGTGYTYNLNGDISNTPNGSMIYVAPGAKFSGGANVGYVFGNGQDINLSVFIRNNNASSSHVFTGDDDDIATPRLPSDWELEDANSANSTFSYESDEINLTVGQTFKLGSQTMLHPYAGLGLRKAVSNQTTNYFDINDEEGDNATVTEQSKAQGIGVVLGTDLSWGFAENWAVTADANVAIMTGKIKSSYVTQDNFDEDVYNLSAESKHSIFQQVTAKIGLSRSFMMNEQEGNVVFGYRVSEYTNAVQSHNFVDDKNDNALVSSLSNSGYSGFYAALNVKFA